MNILNIIAQVERNEHSIGNRGWRITNERRLNEELNIETKVRLTDEMNEQLIIQSLKERTSKSELIRKYITWGIEIDENTHKS